MIIVLKIVAVQENIVPKANVGRIVLLIRSWRSSNRYLAQKRSFLHEACLGAPGHQAAVCQRCLAVASEFQSRGRTGPHPVNRHQALHWRLPSSAQDRPLPPLVLPMTMSEGCRRQAASRLGRHAEGWVGQVNKSGEVFGRGRLSLVVERSRELASRTNAFFWQVQLIPQENTQITDLDVDLILWLEVRISP